MDELVSVVITTKNEEKNIKNILKSIEIQSYKNIEIILVDNYSSDKTKEIANNFNVKTYDCGNERSAQRNFGLKKSKGELALYLDADMILTPGLIES
jgi:glycosyltransferase involved in cell wall biosynthesis